MTKTKSNKPTKQEQVNRSICDCTDCRWAHLVQYDAPRDPLLAECTRKPQPHSPQFPYEVEMARCKKSCPLHEHTDAVKVIEHRVKPMFINRQQAQREVV